MVCETVTFCYIVQANNIIHFTLYWFEYHSTPQKIILLSAYTLQLMCKNVQLI